MNAKEGNHGFELVLTGLSQVALFLCFLKSNAFEEDTMSVNIKNNKSFWTETELSVVTGIPRKTLQRFRKDGSGPPFLHFGSRTIRYPKDQFQNWIEKNINLSQSQIL